VYHLRPHKGRPTQEFTPNTPTKQFPVPDTARAQSGVTAEDILQWEREWEEAEVARQARIALHTYTPAPVSADTEETGSRVIRSHKLARKTRAAAARANALQTATVRESDADDMEDSMSDSPDNPGLNGVSEDQLDAASGSDGADDTVSAAVSRVASKARQARSPPPAVVKADDPDDVFSFFDLGVHLNANVKTARDEVEVDAPDAADDDKMDQDAGSSDDDVDGDDSEHAAAGDDVHADHVEDQQAEDDAGDDDDADDHEHDSAVGVQDMPVQSEVDDSDAEDEVQAEPSHSAAIAADETSEAVEDAVAVSDLSEDTDSGAAPLSSAADVGFDLSILDSGSDSDLEAQGVQLVSAVNKAAHPKPVASITKATTAPVAALPVETTATDARKTEANRRRLEANAKRAGEHETRRKAQENDMVQARCSFEAATRVRSC